MRDHGPSAEIIRFPQLRARPAPRECAARASDHDACYETARAALLREARAMEELLVRRYRARMRAAGLPFQPDRIGVRFEIDELTLRSVDTGVLETIAAAETIAFGAPVSTVRGAVVEMLYLASRPLSPADVVRGLQALGLDRAPGAVYTLLSRLAHSESRVERCGHGLYRWRDITT
jgi:hypothetical protein